MTHFAPIAIVGRGCVLPGAHTPAALWSNVVAGQSAVTDVPAGRWALDPRRVAGIPPARDDVAYSTRGGYVTEFDAKFNAEGTRLDASVLRAFDPVVRWTLHAARDALAEAGLGDVEPTHRERTSVILGNLSFPTAGMARFGERVFLEEQARLGGPLAAPLKATADARGGRPEDRFMSGLPAQLIATALGLEGAAFCLDAACASSLYALQLASTWLHQGRSDVVLCGAVNAADSLFLHVGFTALGALSPTGQTRPFHRDADGLIPGEGAGVVALMRLEDAVAQDRQVLGVVRGVGLSNDGRGRNLLAPSSEGQVRALRSAYATSGVDPSSVGMLECHATGTPLGDGTEVESMRQVFADAAPNSIGTGSLKSNLGHLITGAGVAGLIKTLCAFEHKTLPPTLHVEDPLDVFADDKLPFRLLREAEPWNALARTPRRAGVSAFGFGGNNAHVVVEEAGAGLPDAPAAVVRAGAESSPETAITSLGVRAHEVESVLAFERLLHPAVTTDNSTIIETIGEGEVRVDARGVRFPPNALKASLAQQLLAFEAIREAAAPLEAEIAAGTLDKNRVGVLVGMQCDVEVTTPGIRWRIAEWADPNAEAADWVQSLRDEVGPVVNAERVLGQMPNIPANRGNVQHDFRGLGFTISSEELSGISALRVAQDLLASGTLDVVVVAATDACDDIRHGEAVRALVGHAVAPADAAVAMVIRRVADAPHPVALLAPVELGARTAPPRPHDRVVNASGSKALAPHLGHAQAASGLLEVAAAALDLRRGVDADGVPRLVASGEERSTRVHVTSLGGARGSITVHRADNHIAEQAPISSVSLPLVLALSAPNLAALRDQATALIDDRAALRAALCAPASATGNTRAALVGDDVAALVSHLRTLSTATPGARADARSDIALVDAAAVSEGDIAFAFGGANAPSRGAGAALLRAFPDVARELEAEIGDLPRAFRAATHFSARTSAPTSSSTPGDEPTYLDDLLVGSCLMQTHAKVVRSGLGLNPGASLGLSLGEANALLAEGAWEAASLLADVEKQPLFRTTVATTESGEGFDAARAYFEREGIAVESPVWTTSIVRGDVEAIRLAVENERGAFVSLVHADDECVLAGAPSAVARVLDTTGHTGASVPLAPAVHTPAAVDASEAYRALHFRPTTDTSAKIYSAGALTLGRARLALNADACADAIAAQALAPVDFPALLDDAAKDGIKVMLACGPRGLCAEWARRSRAGANVVAIALDRPGIDDARQIARVAAALFALGAPVDLSAFAPPAEKTGALYFSVPLHRPIQTLSLPNAPAVSAATSSVSPPARLDPPRPRAHGRTGEEDASMPPAPPLPLPHSDVAATAAAPTAGVMAPAPSLDGPAAPPSPQASAQGAPSPGAPVQPPRIAPTLVAAARPRLPSTPAAAPVPASPNVSDGPWAPIAAARAELGEAHRAYVEQAAQVHHRFLEMQRLHAQNLAAVMRGEVSAPAFVVEEAAPLLPAAPVAPPIPLSAPPVQPSIASAPVVASAAAAIAPVAKAPKLSKPEGGHSRPLPPTKSGPATKRPPAPSGQAHADGTRDQPWLHRGELEKLASNKISSVFGELFERQDAFRRQVRMPEPPLLLTDRVLCTDASPGVLEKGRTIWTESDVTWDKWYLHNGRVPPGILIESGQADLLLISWMGVDFENAGQRVYRLLGCDLTYGDALPAVGETLHYDIHIDGFARTGSTHMFFFHSDCRLGGPDGDIVLSVRNGQAGFFDDEELKNSGGVLWTPADLEEDLSGVELAAPKVSNVKSSLSNDDLRAWTRGDGYTCFGAGYEKLAPHVRTPSIQGRTSEGQDMLLIDRVTMIEPTGGPWGRGYLRAELDLNPDLWFFDGHFKDDPCMPGTIMFEGCLQTLSTYLAALGFTTKADGFRFEPVGHKPYPLRCRGQATPSSKELVYEVFIKEINDGPLPRIRADVLVTVDGLKALLCDDIELELVVDWPMSDRPDLLGATEKASGHDAVGGVVAPGAVAPDAIFDQTALLATGWGRPSDAFGKMYTPFDRTRSVPRLPGPPYHFMSRVTELDGPEAGSMKAGVTCAVEYDVPGDSWYFDASPAATMPFAVLLEVALQPCGWLSSYVGSALTSEDALYYRNLDGQGTVHAEIPRDVGTLITRAKMTKSSASGGMIIQEFALSVTARGLDGNETPIYDATTAFGFFPAGALAQQVGIGSTPQEREALAAPGPSPAIDLTTAPARYFDGPVTLPKAPLLMIDRVTGQWPASGDSLAKVRTEKTVDVTEWFFKAHFFQDPVQPGSLGIEAMTQAVAWWMIDQGMGQDMRAPRVLSLALGNAMTWKYRGQVTPNNALIQVEADIRSRNENVVVADCSLWVDGLRIYTATGLAMEIRDED